MTLEECYGKECAGSIREVIAYALSFNQEKQVELVREIRQDASNHSNDAVRQVLTNLANLIDDMKKRGYLGRTRSKPRNKNIRIGRL